MWVIALHLRLLKLASIFSHEENLVSSWPMQVFAHLDEATIFHYANE